MIQKYIHRIRQNYRKRQEKLHKDGLFQYCTARTGYVLLIVMVISTMLISVSSDFLLNAQLNINYMKRFRDEAQAQSVAEAGLNIGKIILKADDRGFSLPGLEGANTDKSIDTYQDIWALDFPEIELGSGTVKVIISDEQSKINISAVSTEYVDQTPFYSILERFFMNMGFSRGYADAVLDWVDENDTKTGEGAETYDYYSTLSNPYNAANAPFDSIDQLLMVRYFTPKIYYGFGGGNAEAENEDDSLVDSNAPRDSLDIMALLSEESGEFEDSDESEEIQIGPERTRKLNHYLRAHGNSDTFNAQINKININTATYRVLLSLSDNMTDEAVRNLIAQRNREPFRKVNEAKEYIPDELIRKNTLTTSSNLFRITSIGYVHGNYIKIDAVYDRSKDKLHYYSIQ